MYRRKVLKPEISNRLYELVQTIAKEKGFDIIKCETYDSDHVSCIVSAPPKLSVEIYKRNKRKNYSKRIS